MSGIRHLARRGGPGALLAAFQRQSPFGKAVCTFALASLSLRLSLALFGCGGGEKVVATTNPVAELSAAVASWNSAFPGVQLRSYSEEARIDTEARRAAVLEEITAPEKAWLPVGNAARPDTLGARRVAENPDADPARVAAWQASVADQVKLGQRVFRLYWNTGGQAFSTLAVANDQGVIYDNMLSNSFLVTYARSRVQATCVNEEVRWPGVRGGAPLGYVVVGVIAHCKDGAVTSCGKGCGVNGLDGSWLRYRIKCEERQVGNTCQLHYTVAITSGFGAIGVGPDGFCFKVSAGSLAWETCGWCTASCTEGHAQGGAAE